MMLLICLMLLILLIACSRPRVAPIPVRVTAQRRHNRRG
jgi:hypothetical protein